MTDNEQREDDDEEWERWMGLTDAQQQAELDSAMREYNDWIDSLTADQQYHYFVRGALESCVRVRKLLRAINMPFLRVSLVGHQKRLLGMRLERQTGMQTLWAD